MNVILTYDDIETLIFSGEDVNYLAYAIIPLHVIGINAAIKYLNNQGIALKGYIFLCIHDITGKHISSDMVDKSNNDLKIYDCRLIWEKQLSCFQKISRLFPKVRRIGSNNMMYIASPYPRIEIASMLQKHGKEYCFITIDDGGGSYLSRVKDTYRYSIIYSKDRSVKSLVTIQKKVLSAMILDSFIYRTKKVERNLCFTIFRSLQNRLEPNNESISYYQEALKKAYRDKYDLISCFEGCVLLNTQCLQESNITDGDLDFELYKEVVAIVNSMGLKVIVKPHPRENNIGKYKDIGCLVFENNSYLQEAILASLHKKPCCIISIFSSTLINAKGLFDIPAISLARIMKNRVEKGILVKMLVDYIQEYKEILDIPRSMEDLELLLNHYAQNITYQLIK